MARPGARSSAATSTSYALKPTMARGRYEYRAGSSNLAGTATTSAATIVVAGRVGQLVGLIAGSGVQRGHGQLERPRRDLPDERYRLSPRSGSDRAPESQTVEQDGTESDCLAARRTRRRYEMYRDNDVNSGYEVKLPPGTYPVELGDAMSASVSVAAPTRTLAISDTTANWTYSTNIASPSPAPRSRRPSRSWSRTGRSTARFRSCPLRERGVHERDGHEHHGQRPDRGFRLPAGSDGRQPGPGDRVRSPPPARASTCLERGSSTPSAISDALDAFWPRREKALRFLTTVIRRRVRLGLSQRPSRVKRFARLQGRPKTHAASPSSWPG